MCVSPRYHAIRGVKSDFLRNRLLLSFHPDLRYAIGQMFVEACIRHQQWFERVFKSSPPVHTQDAKFIESILADDFIATYDDGNQGDKAKELGLVADFNQQVESATQDEFTVRMYGDTAVVRFVLRHVGIKQGQRSELRLRFTDVWVMREGRWLCVSTHSTRIEAK